VCYDPTDKRCSCGCKRALCESKACRALYFDKTQYRHVLPGDESVLALPPARRVRTIIGPAFFAFFPDVIGKRVLFLGEYHVKSTVRRRTILAYPGVVFEEHKWLHDLIKRAPECVDVMLEESTLFAADPYDRPRIVSARLWQWPSSPEPQPLSSFPSALDAISHTFAECYTSDASAKDSCYSPNLRYHYIDSRDLTADYLDMEHRPGEPEVWKSALAALFESTGYGWKAFFNAVRLTWKTLSDDTRFILIAYASGLVTTGRYMYLAYVKDVALQIDPDFPADEMIRIDDMYMHILQQKISKAMSKVAMPDRDKFIPALVGSYFASPNAANSVFDAPMDCYCLLRMFARYDEDKLPRGPEACRSPDFLVNKNVIVHSGRAHSRFYVEFMKLMFDLSPSLTVDQHTHAIEPGLDEQIVVLPEPFDFFH
jgi:hypothetical protein